MRLPKGIHEIKHLEISVDFGLQKRSGQGCSDPDLDLSHRTGVLVDRLASCSGLDRLSYEAAQDQRCHVDMASMLQNLRVDLKLGLQSAVFRLQGFLDIQPPVHLPFGH